MNNNQGDRRKRILFFIEALNGGGAQRVLVNLAQALVRNNYDVFIATNTSIISAYVLPPNVQIFNYREGCETSGIVSRTHLFRKSRTLYNIRKISKETKPDVIVSFMVFMNIDVLLSDIGLRVPIICSEHTTIQRQLSSYANIGRKFVYRLANAVTVLTKTDYRIWAPQMNNLVYMPNPSDPKPLSIIRNKRNKVVLAAGRIDDWKVKGFDSLLMAWGKIWRDYPDWKLAIAGGGCSISVNQLKDIANKAGCKGVVFLGFRKDIDELMASSSVFCLSSRNEGLPMVLIEAMGAECCCVAFDCVTGPSEIIKNNVSGLLVKNQDIDELANALRKVMSDEIFRQQLSANAPKSVAKYSSDRILRRWMILFDKVTKNNSNY